MSQRVLMLNLDIGQSLTGIEASAFARAKVLKHYVGAEPIFVSIYYNPALHQNMEKHKNSGKIDPGMKLINLYDYFQDAVEYQGNLEHGFQFEPSEEIGFATVDENPHDLRLYKRGERIAYVVRHHSNLAVKYINFFHDGKIWRRDWYDARGFLSKVDFIDGENGLMDGTYESYFRPDGSIAITKKYKFDQGKRIIQSIDVYGKKGEIKYRFKDKQEMIYAFLRNITIDGDIIIIDRILDYYQSAKESKLNKKIKIIPIYHSTHYVNHVTNPGNPFTSQLNSYHKEALLEHHLSDAHVVLTKKQKDHIEQRFGKGNFFVIPHSHENIIYTGWEQRNRKLVVMLGRFAVEKQHHLAIKAFAKVVEKHKDAKLQLYGYGEKIKEIEETINKYNLNDSVKILPFQENVTDIYRHAGLMLMTSLNEAFGMVILESLFNGCPVISFDCNYGPSDMIQDGVNGRLVKPQDTDALAQAIIEVFDHPEKHRQMVENASQSMSQFTHEHIATKWNDLFKFIKNK